MEPVTRWEAASVEGECFVTDLDRQIAECGTMRSLRIIREYRIDRPGDFAVRYFPRDHPGWQRIGKCGNRGATGGVGLRLLANVPEVCLDNNCESQTCLSAQAAILRWAALTGEET